MTSRWKKLNYLVPGPKCRMNEDANGDLQITTWADSRPQPTDSDINAVADQDIVSSELDTEAEQAVKSDKVKRLVFEINFDQENRIRVLEGKTIVTKNQYKTVLKNLYKSL